MLCECGCGMAAPIATRTRRDIGHVRGEPTRFVIGHSRRGKSKGGGLVFDRQSGRWRILCRDGSQVYYYRAVVEADLKRHLREDELVHHENDDCSDDRRENLVLTTRPEHILTHREAVGAWRRAA